MSPYAQEALWVYTKYTRNVAFLLILKVNAKLLALSGWSLHYKVANYDYP